MAGFPEYDNLFLDSGKLDKDYPRSARSRRSSFEPTVKDALAILAEVKELHFAPGGKFEYSNSGYVLLALIVEKVTGQTFSQFLQQKIFQPLDMRRSLLYDETRPQIQNVATSYTLEDGHYKDIDYAPQNAIYGEDNIYTTVEDMYKWDQALYTEKLVQATTLKEAFTSGRLNNGKASGYGFGWRVDQFLGLDAVGHGGAWLGFRTGIVRIPSQYFTVVVLANLAQIDAADLANKISKIYLSDKMIFPVAIQLAPDIMQKYVGRYEIEPEYIAEVMLENDSLWIHLPHREKSKLVPESEVTYFFEGKEEKNLTFNKNDVDNVIGVTIFGSVSARKL
jgi:CubicO group peptidase (beta-lactamase class C family)